MKNILGGKILYIEDEIEKQLPTFMKLFKAFLDDRETKELRKLSNDDLVTTQKIKDVLKESDNLVIEIEDSFLGALEHIRKIGNGEDYAFCICDRNLWASDLNKRYKLEDVQKILESYNQEAFDKYKTWEGDFLLLLLALQGFDCTSKFYFLSAYDREDIKSKVYLDCLFSSKRFSKDNFIKKADQMIEQKFIDDYLSHATRSKVLTKYKDIFKIIRSYPALTDSEHFIMDVLSDPIPTYLRYCEKPRGELDKIVNKLYSLYNMKFPNVRSGMATLGPKIDEIQSKMPQYVYFHMKYIKDFGDNYGNHKPSADNKANEMSEISHYTILSLINSFFQVLIWFDAEMNKNNP